LLHEDGAVALAQAAIPAAGRLGAGDTVPVQDSAAKAEAVSSMVAIGYGA